MNVSEKLIFYSYWKFFHNLININIIQFVNLEKMYLTYYRSTVLVVYINTMKLTYEFQINIWDKSVKGFLRYDRTHKQTNRDYNFIFIDIFIFSVPVLYHNQRFEVIINKLIKLWIRITTFKLTMYKYENPNINSYCSVYKDSFSLIIPDF